LQFPCECCCCGGGAQKKERKKERRKEEKIKQAAAQFEGMLLQPITVFSQIREGRRKMQNLYTPMRNWGGGNNISYRAVVFQKSK
jgi:hypothetical protein